MSDVHGEVAKHVAARLVASYCAIEAICLYGSVARGEAGPSSDIDLLVVGTDDALTPSALLDSIDPWRRGIDVSIVYRTRSAMDEFLEEGSRFLIHIRREGVPLHDPHGFLDRWLAAPFEPMPAQEELDIELTRLELYDDPTRFGNNFLFCFAHVYTIAKAVVMARLADDSVYEFNRDRAFARFAALYPNTRSDIQTVQALRPFYGLVSRGRAEPPPFDFKGSSRQLEDAVLAVRRIALAPKSDERVSS